MSRLKTMSVDMVCEWLGDRGASLQDVERVKSM